MLHVMLVVSLLLTVSLATAAIFLWRGNSELTRDVSSCHARTDDLNLKVTRLRDELKQKGLDHLDDQVAIARARAERDLALADRQADRQQYTSDLANARLDRAEAVRNAELAEEECEALREKVQGLSIDLGAAELARDSVRADAAASAVNWRESLDAADLAHQQSEKRLAELTHASRAEASSLRDHFNHATSLLAKAEQEREELRADLARSSSCLTDTARQRDSLRVDLDKCHKDISVLETACKSFEALADAREKSLFTALRRCDEAEKNAAARQEEHEATAAAFDAWREKIIVSLKQRSQELKGSRRQAAELSESVTAWSARYDELFCAAEHARAMYFFAVSRLGPDLAEWLDRTWAAVSEAERDVVIDKAGRSLLVKLADGPFAPAHGTSRPQSSVPAEQPPPAAEQTVDAALPAAALPIVNGQHSITFGSSVIDWRSDRAEGRPFIVPPGAVVSPLSAPAPPCKRPKEL